MLQGLVSREAVSTELAFPLDEFRARVSRVQAQMADQGIDGLVLHQPENLCYLSGLNLGNSGYFQYHALVVPAEGEPILVVRGLEEPSAQRTCWLRQWSIYLDTEPEPITATKRAVEALGLAGGRLGVDEHSWFLTLERFGALRRLLPKATFVAEPRIVDHLRLIKSDNEVSYLRDAARIAERAMAAGIAAVAPGKSELELASAVIDAQVRAGSTWHGGVIASGERALQPHVGASARKLEPGDLVKYELTGQTSAYCSRLMRSVVVGRANREQRAVSSILQEGQDRALAMMVPGQSARAIDDACRAPILAAGLTDRYDYRVGYGLGLIFRPSAGDFMREFTPRADWHLGREWSSTCSCTRRAAVSARRYSSPRTGTNSSHPSNATCSKPERRQLHLARKCQQCLHRSGVRSSQAVRVKT